PVARLEERDVEGAPVERDDAGEAPQVLGQPPQERRLLRVIPHEVLPDAEAIPVDEAEAHEERGGAGAPGEPRGLGVEEGRLAQVESGESRLAAQDGDGVGADDMEAAE